MACTRRWAQAGKLLESGRLAIVPGVGYPEPDRSHFASMAIWQTARLDEEDHGGPGWLGRSLDATPGSSSLFVGAGSIPARDPGPARSGLEPRAARRPDARPGGVAPADSPDGDDLAAFVPPKHA